MTLQMNDGKVRRKRPFPFFSYPFPKPISFVVKAKKRLSLPHVCLPVPPSTHSFSTLSVMTLPKNEQNWFLILGQPLPTTYDIAHPVGMISWDRHWWKFWEQLPGQGRPLSGYAKNQPHRMLGNSVGRILEEAWTASALLFLLRVIPGALTLLSDRR